MDLDLCLKKWTMRTVLIVEGIGSDRVKQGEARRWHPSSVLYRTSSWSYKNRPVAPAMDLKSRGSVAWTICRGCRTFTNKDRVTATLDPKTVKRTKEIRQGHSEREPSLENTQQTRTGGENGVTSLVTVLDSCEAVACSMLRTCENAIVSRDLKILVETGRYKGQYGFST